MCLYVRDTYRSPEKESLIHSRPVAGNYLTSDVRPCATSVALSRRDFSERVVWNPASRFSYEPSENVDWW